MGSSYVNDFDFNNRSYRVYVQADKQFRATSQDMKRFYVRSDSGAMVPLENLISITQTTTPQVISHYNLFRSAEIDGSPAPGYSSGQAIAAMEQLASKMPQGFSYSWTGLSLEELAAGGTSLILFGLGTLVGLPNAVSAIRELRASVYRVAGRSHGLTGRAWSAMDSRACKTMFSVRSAW